MPSVLAIVLGLCAAGALIALAFPFLLLCLRQVDADRRDRARRHAVFSSFTIACAIAYLLDLSFAGHALNIIAVAAVVICAGALTLSAFSIRPTYLALPVGLLAACAWLINLAGVSLAFLDRGPVATAQLGSGLHCRETEYGYFLSNPPGWIMDIHRRYLFVDHRIYRQFNPAAGPVEVVAAPEGLPDAPARCHALIDAQRSAATHGL
ncbi:MAG TPA: hypothetical protein VF793_19785 [Telluria sp.]